MNHPINFVLYLAAFVCFLVAAVLVPNQNQSGGSWIGFLGFNVPNIELSGF